MVRFLTYANQFDVEGLIATTSIHQQKQVGAAAHPPDRRGLRQGPRQPPLQSPGSRRGDLLSRVSEGLPGLRHGRRRRGQGFPWLALLIARRRSRRPAPALGVGVGRSERAGAGAVEGPRHAHAGRLAKFVAKLRVYTISDQDDTGPWIRKNFPGPLLHRQPRLPRRRRLSLRDVERHQRRQLPRPLRRRGFRLVTMSGST